MKIELKEKLHRVSQYLETHMGSLVLDGDTHPTSYDRLAGAVKERYDSTPNYYQGRPITPEDLLKEMDQAGVDLALCWQNPATTLYTNDPDENARLLWEANKDIFEISSKYPKRFFAAGWTDPRALGMEGAKQLVDMLVDELGFSIIKMNPAQNEFPIDSAMVKEVVDHIVTRGAFPAFHYGGDTEFTPANGLQVIANRHPETPVIAVHMGGGGSHYVHGDPIYLETRRLGLELDNLFFILSAKRDTHIASDLITYACEGMKHVRKMACGSDAPYGNVIWNYGGYRALFAALQNPQDHPDKRVSRKKELFSDEMVQRLMGRNLAELILRSIRNLIAKNS